MAGGRVRGGMKMGVEDLHVKLGCGELVFGIGRVRKWDEVEAVLAEDNEMVCGWR